MKVLQTIGFLLSVSLISSAQTLARQETKLNRPQTKEAERRLSELGYWTGPVDGLFDAASRAALIAFQNWEGRPISGRLTMSELEAIRTSNVPRPRESDYAHVEVDLDRQVLMSIDEEGRVRVLRVSTGSGKPFMEDGQESVAHTPRGRFVVYDKSYGWEDGIRGTVYYAKYISGAVAIHGYLSVPTQPASHGCIRVPVFAAREVSRMLKLGTIVLVYDKTSFVSGKELAANPSLKEAVRLSSAAPDYTVDLLLPKPKTNRSRSRLIRA
jgi:peptidoglycan hydrolase-like protein with peptidoglycan-binding domain